MSDRTPIPPLASEPPPTSSSGSSPGPLTGQLLGPSTDQQVFPVDLGFTMPAEWGPHAATWTVWPRDDDYWSGCLAIAQQDFARFLNILADFEPVHVLVHDAAAAADARAQLANTITLHTIPNRDIWLRDSGPLFVTRGEGSERVLAAVNWEFNAWGDRFPWKLDNQIPQQLAQKLGLHLFSTGLILEGGSIEVNGAGLCLTTRQCLRTPSRNPQLSETDIEQALHDYLGIVEVIWLEEGLEGDHTDGHIDTITRFVGERTVVTSVSDDPRDANFAPMQENLAHLEAFRDRSGQSLRVIPLPLPQQRIDFGGERLPLTYANFYIANGIVLVPTYGEPNDDVALEVLRDYFGRVSPDNPISRDVIGLPAKGLLHGGGAFHCATQQQPAGELWVPAEQN